MRSSFVREQAERLGDRRRPRISDFPREHACEVLAQTSSAASSAEKTAVACERGEERVDVLGHVVGMRGDAQVAVALRGDDPVCLERGDERGGVGRRGCRRARRAARVPAA